MRTSKIDKWLKALKDLLALALVFVFLTLLMITCQKKMGSRFANLDYCYSPNDSGFSHCVIDGEAKLKKFRKIGK